MEKIKAKPMKLGSFISSWIFGSLSIWILNALLLSLIHLVVQLRPLSELFDLFYYHYIIFNNPITLVCITIEIGFLQAWLFRWFLHIHIPKWELATMIGGGVGIVLTLIASRLYLTFWREGYDFLWHFALFFWFFGISFAQWYLIRKRLRLAWLWILAHVALSFFYPLPMNDIPSLLFSYFVAAASYAVVTLFVLQKLGEDTQPFNDEGAY